MIQLKWKRQWGGSDCVVWINIRKFDALWRFDKGFYVPAGHSEYMRRVLLTILARKERLYMPHAEYYEGQASFTDGRHRFAWCRDHGVRYMPVTVEGPKQVKVFKRLFGTSARICRVHSKALSPKLGT